MYPALLIRKEEAEDVRRALYDMRIVDGERRFIRRGEYIEIPVLEGYEARASEFGRIIQQKEPVFRERPPTPFSRIVDLLQMGDESALLPRKWEMYGDVLVLRIHPSLEDRKFRIAEAYATVLGARTVLRDTGGVEGEFRQPVMEFLIGEDAETTHLENGVRFTFDASRIMFSSGNIDERVRMAYIPSHSDVIVDMFAGIGYFSIPMAVHSRPKKIYSCEKNPESFEYLKKNIELNHVESIVSPILGDNRDVCPEGVADRVVMGYVGTTHEFFRTAFSSLKSEGTIHYHETCPEALIPERPVLRIKAAAREHGYTLEGYTLRKIKSYAPGILHVVVDARVKRNSKSK